MDPEVVNSLRALSGPPSMAFKSQDSARGSFLTSDGSSSSDYVKNLLKDSHADRPSLDVAKQSEHIRVGSGDHELERRWYGILKSYRSGSRQLDIRYCYIWRLDRKTRINPQRMSNCRSVRDKELVEGEFQKLTRKECQKQSAVTALPLGCGKGSAEGMSNPDV
uniref:Uncharacterized protein n=1 Tax=Leersia perrieri TaxID=77586 RepID=A0A0D9W311_9ORYZ